MTDDDSLIARLRKSHDSLRANCVSANKPTSLYAEAADRIATQALDCLIAAHGTVAAEAELERLRDRIAALTVERDEADELVVQMRKRAEKAEAERDALLDCVRKVIATGKISQAAIDAALKEKP